MGTQGLSLKWRPQLFQDVVGQEPIIQTLKQALAQNRVAHAYLFAGPRGTGKTSTARAFAKSVNCENYNTLKSDISNCTCSSCNSINDYSSNTLVELDAASSCLLYTSPSPRDATLSRMPSSA
mgnify:CR=1 FL=1